MSADFLLYPMFAHVAWTSVLYALLTLVRAPAVWGVGKAGDGSNPAAAAEPRVSANLSSQFEWPVFFYVICLLLIVRDTDPGRAQVVLAWVFIAGRLLHSAVHILMTNVRLRGIVFTINFLAVLAMWVVYAVSEAATTGHG